MKNISNSKLLSVVMPVHNAGKYLSECLKSVIDQTYVNFELIAIDDNSVDESYAILKKYSEKDNRLIVMKNEQQSGAAYTRNKGLHAAIGEYIIFLDADDFFDMDFFENMILSLEKSEADVAICAVKWRDERSGREVVRRQASPDFRKKLSVPFQPYEYNCKIFYCTEVMPFNKVIRRRFLLEKKIEFQDISNCNDVYFGIITLSEADRIVYLHKPYIHYRYNTGCQISTDRYKKSLCVCYAYQKIREEFIARGLWESFSRMYYDSSVAAISSVIKRAYKPKELLGYVQGEGGMRLGFTNLYRRDFSSVRIYGLYRILVYGRQAIIGNMSDIVKCFLGAFKDTNFSGVYWLLGHYIMLVMRGLKKKFS